MGKDRGHSRRRWAPKETKTDTRTYEQFESKRERLEADDHGHGQAGVENNLVATGAKPNIGTTNAEGVLGGFPSVASRRLLNARPTARLSSQDGLPS